ncbi:hypothetical protein GY45DRAFT_1373468 [Cubamyces sp. BRFM 1775]|nr:hypothetical protein GY45DRAFT_1373468 [Cubamyces sp. BRFM 1775]
MAVFDKALARDNWPVNNEVMIPFTPLKPPMATSFLPEHLCQRTGATGGKDESGARPKDEPAARCKNASAIRGKNASAVGGMTAPVFESKKRSLEEEGGLGEPSPMAPSTLFSETNGPRSKRTKHAHSGKTPASNSRVTRSQTKRSGQLGRGADGSTM